MKVAELKVIDVIQMPQFRGHIDTCIKELFLSRHKILEKYPGVHFKRGPIERLQEKGVFGPKPLAVLYGRILDKTIDTNEYPSALRMVIKKIGDEALHRTVIELNQAEKNEKSN